MEGTINTFLASKGYGFIKGDDNDYFLHQREMQEGQTPRPGMRVEFEEAVTPKGYRARRVRPAVVGASTGRYTTPSKLVETKLSELRDWELIESVPWYVIGSSRDSPDAARADLLNAARRVDANAVMLVKYFKTTGSESGTGRGVHHFTIHNFRGVPAIVGRSARTGGKTKQELIGLAGRVDAIASEIAREKERRQDWGVGLVVSGLIALCLGLGIFGLHFFAWIPGALLILGSGFCFRRGHVWLEPMAREAKGRFHGVTGAPSTRR